MLISVAHATRRPAKALEIRKLWLEAAAHPENVEWIFGLDHDDEASLRLLMNETHVISSSGGCVAAFNCAAAQTTGEIIIGGCDDVYPVPKWDQEIIKRFSKFEVQSSTVQGSEFLPRVLLTGDGTRPDRLATFPIVTRAWYNRFGWLFPPQFKGIGADVWLTERASRDGCLVNAEDLQFEHRHAFYRKAPMDDVYARQNDPANYVAANAVLKELLEPLPISLCMIVGNEASIIERCLDSAKGVFDELCIVQATGTISGDSTLAIANYWCSQNAKKCAWRVYENATPFPHLDNFAAARNLSFSLATGYWCLWLDADDLLDPVNCERIREASANSRFEGQMFRYVMPTGGEYYRERLIKRGKGTWQDAVHETCKVDGTMCKVPQPQILHAPPPGKDETSGARNFGILESNVKRLTCPRARFYYHEELLRLGRKEEALSTGLLLAAELDGDYPAEKYEVLLNLAELQPAQTDHWMHEALKLDPLRREAMSQLVQFELNRGEVQRAAQYFRWMEAIPLPNPLPWTHRKIWHGWARNYLKVKILRAADDKRAVKEHEKYLADPEYAAGVAHFESLP